MSNKIYPSLACRLEFFAEDADGLPVTGLTHSDVSAAGYCRIQDGVMSSTTSLSLTSSAAYTAAVSSGQFITINSSRGHYAIDCPSGASDIAYDYALAYVTFTAGHNVYAIRHEIDATLQIVTSNNATLGALSGRIPAALVSGRMDASVGAMAANTLTASALASDAVSEISTAVDSAISANAVILNLYVDVHTNLVPNVSYVNSNFSTILDALPASGHLAGSADTTGAAVLDSAAQAQIGAIQDNTGYLLALNAGAVSDPQSASSTYVITVGATTYTAALAGQTAQGVRTAPILSKA